MKEHLKALLEKRNALAVEVNAKGEELIERRNTIDTTHTKDSPEYKEAYGALEAEIVEQQAKRREILSIDETIEAAETITERTEKTIGADPDKAVTETALIQQNLSALYPQQKQRFYDRLGIDFHRFLQTNKLNTLDNIQGRRAFSVEPTKSGDKFHCVSSFYASFGSDRTEHNATAKSLGLELGIAEPLNEALKSTRDTFQKSMFTQHPLAGGDGSLYDPTAVFPGNTGGLCEYFIDNDIDVLPYAPVSFLECLPIRRIPKSYLLYVRQTLRVNNASAVGESVVLTGINNPTGAPVDFQVTKPESEFGFSQAKAYTLTFADTIPVSEEFLEDCPQIADIVENQLMENVRQEFYDQIINGDGSDGSYPELLGLLAQVGLSTRVHRGAASFMGTAMGAGAVDDNIYETLQRAIWDAQAFGYNVDCILLSQTDYIKIMMYKDENGKPLYSDCAVGTICGVKLKWDTRMPAGTALVGAFRQVSQVLIRRAIRLDIGWVDDQFKTDMLTLRATMRGGLVVKVPHAIIRVSALV